MRPSGVMVPLVSCACSSPTRARIAFASIALASALFAFASASACSLRTSVPPPLWPTSALVETPPEVSSRGEISFSSASDGFPNSSRRWPSPPMKIMASDPFRNAVAILLRRDAPRIEPVLALKTKSTMPVDARSMSLALSCPCSQAWPLMETRTSPLLTYGARGLAALTSAILTPPPALRFMRLMPTAIPGTFSSLISKDAPPSDFARGLGALSSTPGLSLIPLSSAGYGKGNAKKRLLKLLVHLTGHVTCTCTCNVRLGLALSTKTAFPSPRSHS